MENNQQNQIKSRYLQKQVNKITVKKDKLFVFVLACVAAGLVYQTITTLLDIVLRSGWNSMLNWVYLLCDGLAIYAVFFLLQNYRKRIREEKARKIEEALKNGIKLV